MNSVVLSQPVLVCFYGYPGSGKTYLARNMADHFKMAHVDSDRIRSELFQNPRYDAQENAIVIHLMNYMTEEFLKAGVSVAYDLNATRVAVRRKLREMAKKNKAEYIQVWIQIDPDSAFERVQSRDRRTSDDKHAQPHTQTSFNAVLDTMQNPQPEESLVVSGKHTFSTQKSAIVSRFYQMGLASSQNVRDNLAMPELVNLVPAPQLPQNGRVDMSRRNISIR